MTKSEVKNALDEIRDISDEEIADNGNFILMSEYIKLAELGKLICERDIRCQLESQGYPPLKSEQKVVMPNEKIAETPKVQTMRNRTDNISNNIIYQIAL